MTPSLTPNCAALTTDSNVNAAQGAALSAKGAILSAKGAVLSAKGAVLSAKGAVLSAKGAVLSAKGALLSAKGAILSTEGAVITPKDPARILVCGSTRKLRHLGRGIQNEILMMDVLMSWAH